MILKSPQEEEAVRRMQKIYLDAERKIVAEITRKRSLGYVDYAEVASLERVQAILTKMQDDTFTYAPIMVETIFHGQGEKNAAGYANARALTATQTAVVQTLVNNLLGEVLEVSETAYNSAREYLTVGRLEGQTLRSAALEAVASQEAIGASWTMAQKQMTAELMGKGITGFIDKAGRKWSLTDYCNMAVRTTAKQAAVASILTEDDYDLWQIVKIGTTCPVCAVYEGRVYSKSGTNPDYPPLASAFGKIDPEGANNLENTYLNIHPNCLHTLIRYTTIGKSEKQIQKDKDFSSFEKNPITHDPRTKKQREAYHKKMRDRQKLVNDTHQWKRYKAVLGNECPGWDDFIKHKRAGDDVYKSLESKFRSFSIKAAKLDKEVFALAPSSNIKEAKSITETFAGNVHYSKVDVDGLNKINEPLQMLKDKYKMAPLNEIRIGKYKDPAASNGMKLRIDNESLREYKPTDWSVVLENARSKANMWRSLERSATTRAKSRLARKNAEEAEFLLKFKRWGYPENMQDIIIHEGGHILSDQYFGMVMGRPPWFANLANISQSEAQRRIKLVEDTYKKAMDSGDIFDMSYYASTNHHEFFAESFLAREKGIVLPDYILRMLKETITP